MFRKNKERKPAPPTVDKTTDGLAGFAIPEPVIPDETVDTKKGLSLIEILEQLYQQKREQFVKPIFDASLDSSCDILNELFTFNITNEKPLTLELDTITSDTAPMTVSKNAVTASFDDAAPAAKARQALEMAFIAANNPALMNSEAGIPLIGDNPETSYFLFLAAQKMGFADKILQAGYEPPEIPPEHKEQFQQLIDNELQSFSAIAKGFATPATDATNEPESEPAQEPISEPVAENTEATEPHISKTFNDIVNDERYDMAVEYAAQNGTISRNKFNDHVKAMGGKIGSATITKIFNAMEDAGLLSEPTSKGRAYMGPPVVSKENDAPFATSKRAASGPTDPPRPSA